MRKNNKILGCIFIFATSIFFLNSCSNKTEKNVDITKSDDVYVSFDTAGGTVIKNFEVDDYYRIEKPLNPTKDGSIFVGWYEDKLYKNKFDFNDQILKDKILYAKWLEVDDLSDFTYVLNSNNTINTNNVDNVIKINGLKNNNIYEIDIPEGVSSIEANTFSNNIIMTSVSLPSTLKKIDSQAFIECENLRSVYYNGSIDEWLNIEFVSYESNPMLYANDFYTRNDNGNVKHNNQKYSLLEDIEIPSNISRIGQYQFCGFNSVKDIVIPKNVITIGQGAFSGCSSLEKMTLPFVGYSRNDSSSYGYIFGTREYIGGVNTSQIYRSASGSNYSGNYYIPYNLKEVIITDSTILQYGAFSNCSNLTVIKLNEGITNINSYALSGCSSLKNIIIPNSVLSIGGYALAGCSSLETLTIPFVGNKRYESSDEVPQYPLGYIFGSSNYNNSKAIEQKYYAKDNRYGYNKYFDVTYYFPNSLIKVVVTDSGTLPEYAFLNCGYIDITY